MIGGENPTPILRANADWGDFKTGRILNLLRIRLLVNLNHTLLKLF
jgi:hypothetical protein